MKKIKINYNLILNGELFETNSIKVDVDRSTFLSDVGELIKKKHIKDIKKTLYLSDYDFKPDVYFTDLTKRKILYGSYLNKNVIDWDIDFNNLDLLEASKRIFNVIDEDYGLQIDVVFIIGVGGAGIDDIYNLFSFIKDLYHYCKLLYRFVTRKKFSYNKFKEITNYDITFLGSLLEESVEWKKGFMFNQEFEDKWFIEKTIMKNLNFKFERKSNNWIKKESSRII